MDYIDASIDKLIHFEGMVRWMYQDTHGLVTIGVGEMLPNEAEACKLRMHGLDGPALDDEIKREFARVKAMAPGLDAKAYYIPSALVMLAYDIRTLLMRHVLYFDGVLAQFYKGYPGFSLPVKVALLDMVYNLGPSKLESEYVNFNAAVNKHDWQAAARHCHRRGPNEERNTWTAQQFAQAGNTNPMIGANMTQQSSSHQREGQPR